MRGACIAVAALLALTCAAAAQTDEIQVYDAQIAPKGILNLTLHDNYTFSGLKAPRFPGGLVPDHTLNGVPEFAYGVTDWFEQGLYLPLYSVASDRGATLNGFKIRELFVTPDAANRPFFYGVNFEFSNQTPPFAQTRLALEIRPIIGVRNSEYEFIVNPIVDIGFGKYGEADFAPAARIARKFGEDLYAGFEYYADFGKIGDFPKLATGCSTRWCWRRL